MKRARTHFLAVTTAMVSFGASLLPASAQIVGNDLLAALNQQLSYQGIAITGGDVSTSGNSVTISNATMSTAGGDEAFTISEIRMDGVQPTSDGGYTVASATIPAFEVDESGTTASFGGIQVTDLAIASPNETDIVLRGGVFKTMTVGPIAVSEDGRRAFSVAGVAVEVADYQPGEPWASSMAVSDFELDTTILDDPNASRTMAALGYETLTGDITANGSWAPSTGQMLMEDFVISVDDAASIGIDLNLGGYTVELVEAMQQISAAAQNDQAAGMAMLGLMQQIEIGGAAITLTDASLTNKLLEFFGQQQGTNADGMRAFAKGLLPIGLAQLQSPEFAAKATAAIGQFLDNPGTLIVEAQPAAPIPVLQLAAPVMSGNPAQLIDALSLEISAQ